MKHLMNINGYKAVIALDPKSGQFRGEFVRLNGSADFHAADAASLKREGEVSLKVFLTMCLEDGVESRKHAAGCPGPARAGRIDLRLSPIES